MRYIDSRWQGGSTDNPLRLWARFGGENVIIANFDVSTVLRHETKVANCRYARAAVNFCSGESVETIERLNARGLSLGDILMHLRNLRENINTIGLTPVAADAVRSIDVLLGRA